MRVTPSSGLSSDEIERLIAEAVNSADIDRHLKEVIGLRTKLESLVRNTSRTFKEFGSTLTSEHRQEGVEAINAAEAAVKTDDIEDIRQAMRDVEQLANQLTLVMLNPQAGGEEPNERL